MIGNSVYSFTTDCIIRKCIPTVRFCAAPSDNVQITVVNCWSSLENRKVHSNFLNFFMKLCFLDLGHPTTNCCDICFIPCCLIVLFVHSEGFTDRVLVICVVPGNGVSSL